MSRYDNNNNSRLGLLDVAEIACFIVFLVLKLVGVIDWSWWWVTAPLWGGFLLNLFIILIVFIVMWIYIKWDGRHY